MLGVPMAVGVGRAAWRRLTGRHDPAATWDEQASFVAELGHDPETLLGPRPVDG